MVPSPLAGEGGDEGEDNKIDFHGSRVTCLSYKICFEFRN
jgi:hypothetical protein